MDDTRKKWDAIYKSRSHNASPAFVLTEYADLIPDTGRALDIATGKGINAMFLAAHGLEVDAWDISEVAIDSLTAASREEQLSIRPLAIDIKASSFPHESYDVVINCHYLDRGITDAIVSSLRPGGLVLFQTFTADKTLAIGPKNPGFLLQNNELPRLFQKLDQLVYRDDSDASDPDHPLAGRACFIGRKPT